MLPDPSLIAIRCSLGIDMVIKLTLFQFPKIIQRFAAVFWMIDSFGDFRALLLINHCLRGRCKRAQGTWLVHGGGGAAQNRSTEVTVSGEDDAKGNRKTLVRLGK